MVFYVSGDREEEILIKSLASSLATTNDRDEYEWLRKMVARALTCREKQGQKKSRHSKSDD